MSRLFSFDTLITPGIIRFLFYVGVVLSCLFGLVLITAGNNIMGMFGQSMGGLSFIIGIIAAFVGILVSRVLAEMILVVFMIRDELAWQRQSQEMSRRVAAE